MSSCAPTRTRSWSPKISFFLTHQPPLSASGASTPALRRPWALIPAAVTTAIVISLSLGNALQIETSWLDVPWIDKVQHFLAYACLGVLWSFAFRQNRWSAGLRLWGMLFTLGVSLEIMQWAFYPNRFFEFGDMLANGAGAFAGVYLFLIVLRTFPPKK